MFSFLKYFDNNIKNNYEGLTDASGNTNSTKTDISGNVAIKKTEDSKKDDSKKDDSKKTSDSINELGKAIFNKSTIILVILFLAIYFIVYFILGFFLNKGGESTNFQTKVSRTFDIFILVAVLIVIGLFTYSYSDKEKEEVFKDLLNNTKEFIDKPSSIFVTGFIIIALYVILFLFRIPMSRETKPFFVYFIESLAWIIFLIIAFVDFFKYVLGISITDMLSKLMNPKEDKKEDKKEETPAPKPIDTNEVFNISNNLYTYEDAQAICGSYGAKLATYDQIENSYKNGAEWCNYGWSDGQMAFFPTQKATWTELQKFPKHKNDCGRPGVNGGYIHNPNVKFGVNCYGKKPKANPQDLSKLNAQGKSLFPKSETDVKLDKKVEFWKQNGDKMLKLNSFNNVKWSEF
jgi:hypothetical protein